MTAYRTVAAAFVVLALALTALLFSPPAGAHPGHKVGPVCTVKQAKVHPKKCIVILTPKSTQPDVTVQVTPLPQPKA